MLDVACNSNQVCKRYVLQPKGALSIQGIGLREEIYSKAFDKVCGYARNLSDGAVEVIASAENSEKLKLFEESLKGIELTGKKITEYIDLDKDISSAPENIDFLRLLPSNGKGRFFVLRENELQEMVWALQGAGKQFEYLGKHLVKEIRDRDSKKEEKRKAELLEAVSYELNSISDALEKNRLEAKRRFNIFAIENFLKECPAGIDSDFFRSLRHLVDYAKEVNDLLEHPSQANTVKDDLSEIDALLKQIEPKLDKLLKREKE